MDNKINELVSAILNDARKIMDLPNGPEVIAELEIMFSGKSLEELLKIEIPREQINEFVRYLLYDKKRELNKRGRASDVDRLTNVFTALTAKQLNRRLFV